MRENYTQEEEEQDVITEESDLTSDTGDVGSTAAESASTKHFIEKVCKRDGEKEMVKASRDIREWAYAQGFDKYKFTCNDRNFDAESEFFKECMEHAMGSSDKWMDNRHHLYSSYGKYARTCINQRRNNVIGQVKKTFTSKYKRKNGNWVIF